MEKMKTNNSSSQRLLAVAAVVVVALLAVNAFLLFNKYSQDKVIEEKDAKFVEADKLATELEKQYHEALSELEELRTGNTELNAIIDQQKLELKEQKDRITSMIRDGGELNKAKAEMRNMKAQVQGYVAQIEQLKTENELLKTERDQLNQQNTALTSNLDSAQMKNMELASVNQTIIAEKDKVVSEKDRLSEKVNLASVIKTATVNGGGYKVKGNGKEVVQKKAKNVDKLKVIFKTTANEITRPGVETFHVRIIDQTGVTLAISEMGSGKFYDKSNNQELPFTGIKEYDYVNDEAEITFVWQPNSGGFLPGKYQVEIYNKGHLAGKGSFDLK